MDRLSYWIMFLAFSSHLAYGQNFTLADTLRGSITPERAWWDLEYYNLDVEVDIDQRFIKGSNVIHYEVLESHNVLQIDLQDPLLITKVEQDGQELKFDRVANAHFIQLTKRQEKGSRQEIKVYYEGHPHEALNAPWDGGVSWSTDAKRKPFVASSCQGIGASIWWPCKDHMYDEADSILVAVTVPQGLMHVGNGRLRSQTNTPDGKTRTEWFVGNPINNYAINLNIANYDHFGEVFQGVNGELTLDYYVLKENLEKAKKQFAQVPDMLKAFEDWFGPYPFYEDGFKLVEVPYLGMEHQSAVTYGNGYQNGYRGTDLSNTGWGLKFDFIIIHETGHEWFANSITYKDQADMWIHESFTAYSECLYLESLYGKEAGADYVIGTRFRISNDVPIIPSQRGVNARGSGDMYYKGSNMLHTIRQVVDNDILWKNTLRDLNKRFFHQTVNSDQIINAMVMRMGKNLTSVFKQYLQTTQIPILETITSKSGLRFRWTNAVEGFAMPVKIIIDNKPTWINPTGNWRFIELDNPPKHISVDRNFYVGFMNHSGE